MQSTATIKFYEHPPIVEATIEIRSTHTLSSEEQRGISRKLKTNYPNAEDLKTLDFNFEIDHTKNLVKKNDPTVKSKGIRLSSKDQADVVVVLPQSIVASRLAPYLGWDVFCKDVMNVWKKWRQVQKNIPLTRVGARYINRIDIPISFDNSYINIADYLTIFPENTVYNGEPLSNYFIYITKHTPFKNWFVNITSTVQQPAPMIDRISLILDIDVYYQQDEFFFKEDSDLMNVLEEARRIKNEVFQQIITNKTEELFRK